MGRALVRGALASVVVAASVLGASVLGAAAGATPALATSTVTVTSSANPSIAGTIVTYRATVAGASSAPTGTVVFKDGGTTVGGCAARPLTPATGTTSTATCTPPASLMTGGTHTITATYGGSSTYNPATGTLAGGQVVNPQATALSISSPTSGSSTPVGAPVTYTATLTFTADATFTPTGTVSFEDGTATVCGSAGLHETSAEEYTATCKEPGSTMTLGTHHVTASYAGDTNFAAAASAATYTHLVAQGSSAITLASGGPGSVVVGTEVTYTATVTNPSATSGTGIAPTGHVHFSLPGGVTTCGSVTLTVNEPSTGASQAQCSVALPVGTYSSDITASYTGDANYTGSGPSNALSQTVTQATPTVSVSSSAPSSTAGVPVTYTARVTGVTGFAPSGTVTFSDGSNTWTCSTGTPSVAGDVATYSCTETSTHMTAGTHAITAAFGGDANFKSASGTLAGGQQVAKSSSTLSIAPSASPVYAGAPQAWVVTATGGTSTGLSPTGSVTLTDTVGGSVVWRCTETLGTGSSGSSTTTGTCAETGALLTTGTHLVTAAYGGDANFDAATAATATETVVADPVEITLASSAPGGSPLGQAVTYTVTVHGLNGATVPPSGTVTVTDSSAPPPGFSCTSVVGTRGTPSANVTTYTCAEPGTALDEGTHVVHATFNGDTYYAGGGTASLTQKVGTSTDVTIKIGTSGTPSYPGQKVTYTATVTGSTAFAPTAPVVFTNDLSGTATFSCTSSLTSTPPATSTGNATVYTCAASGAKMPQGTQTVTAEFEGAGGGDHNYPVDASASLTQQVVPDATTTTVAAGAAVPLGTAPTYTATVTPAHGTLPVGGTVAFSSNGTPVAGCTATPVVTGVATCTPASRPGAGSYQISAVFQGTSGENYLASASTAPATQVVDKGATSVSTVRDTAGVGPHPAGVEQTFTATVATAVAGFTPTGTVTFSDATGTICTAPISGGTATCSGYSAGYTVPGPDTVTATYDGDTNFDGSHGTTGSGSPTFSRTTPQPLQITNVDTLGGDIPATRNIASFNGQPVTYVATIAGNGLVVPGGKVTFTDTAGGTTVWTATCTLVDGTVSCTEPGSDLTDYLVPHAITATYQGDTDYFTYTATPGTPDTATYTQHVATPQTTIKMVSGTPSPGVIQPVNGTATLKASLSSRRSGGTRTFTSGGDGYVYFFDNGNPIASCSHLAVTGTSVSGTTRTATMTCTAPLAEGTDVFTAAYQDPSGATGYSTARTTDNGTTPGTYGVPQEIVYTVVYYPTVTNVTAVATVGGGSPVAGQTTTITATVVPTAGATRLPTGPVAFVVNGSPITCTGGDQTLDGTNPPSATCVTKQLPGGTDVIQARYTTDGTYASSVGSYSVLVGKQSSVTTITGITRTLPTTPPISGQPLRFSVKVAPGASGSGIVPTGTVTINATGATGPLCTVTLTDGSGTCTNTAVAAPAGTPTQFTATYGGDASFSTSTSAPSSMLIVHQKATFQRFAAATAATPSSTTVVYGQPIIFTVTLSPQLPGSVATGTVAVTGPAGGPSGTLCTITLTQASDNSGSCTFSRSTQLPNYVPGGTQVFSASYSGDQTFDPSSTGGGGQVSVHILPATATSAITIAPQNPVYGQVPSFHFTVSPTSTGSTPAGTVDVTSSATGGTVLCTARLSGGAGSCTSTVMPPVAQNVKYYANYTDTVDRDYQATTPTSMPASGYVVANVLQATTTTSVTVAPSAKYGVGQTFHVTVSPQISGSPSPGGTVTVTAAGVTQPLCPPIVLDPGAGGDGPATGSCTSTVAVPAGTSITYTATYSGDASFQPSSGTTSGKVTKASTTTSVRASSNGTWGSEQTVVFTATVGNGQAGSSGTPTGGTVAVSSGGTALCTATVNAGSASCSPAATALSPGSSQTVTATYGGNADFAGSTGSTTVSIAKASASAVLSPVPASVIYGNEASATFAFSVTPQFAAAGTPTGKVTVKAGSTVLCTATLSSGAGSCTTTNTKLVPGAFTVTATYTSKGSAYFTSGSVSAGQSLEVTKASTTLTLVVSRASITSGKETVANLISATVAPQFTGTPGGTVTVKAYGTGGTSTTLCTVTLSGGTGSCPALGKTALPVGTYSLVGTYSGDGNFTGGSTSSASLAVTAGSTATSVTFSPAGGVALGTEESATFTPTVTKTGAGTPTGTVTVTATNTSSHVSTTVCTLPVATADGSHSCSPGAPSLLPPGTYAVTATYPGDPNFGGSSGTDGTSFTVQKASSSTLTLTLSPTTTSVTYGNETTAGYSVTFGGASPAPTGTVTVHAGGTTLCTVTLATGQGSCSVASPTALGAGPTHAVVATYTGDANYQGSVSSTTVVNLAVTKATTTPSVSLSESSATFGDEGTVTAAVHVTPQFAGTPTGTVTVKAGTTTLCSFTLPATAEVGTCPLAASALPARSTPYSVTATYTGDANFTGATSASQPLTVTKATSTTSLSVATGTKAAAGQMTQVGFGATVAPEFPGSTPAPTGTVTFTATNTATHTTYPLCTFTVGSSPCHPSANALPAGTYTVTGTYSGNGNYQGSTATAPLTVKQAGTSVLLSVIPGSVGYGSEQHAVFTATVTPDTSGTPTGTVAVTSGATTLCTITLSGGTGSCSPTATQLAPGSYPATGTYSGDGDFSGSTDGPVAFVVTRAAASVTSLTLSPHTVAYGSEGSVTFSVSVAPPSGSVGVPTGTVDVSAGATTLCTVTLANGTGTCTTSATALPATPTAYTVVASYLGDANFPPSASGSQALTVSKVSTATPSSVSPVSVRYGAEGTSVFSVTVIPVSGTGIPTGTVAVASGATPLCTVTLVGGTGTCSPGETALPVAGSLYTVTSTYSGDQNFTPSSSSTAWQITIAGTSTQLVVTPASRPYGAESGSLITATVLPATSGDPTGPLTITNGTTVLCRLTLTATEAGVASCRLTDLHFPVVGSPYQLTASYLGDNNFAGSQSTPEPFTVTQATTTTTLVVSTPSVTYGAETATTFSVTVTSTTTGTPTGAVTVLAGTTVLCTVTLTAGAGTCSPQPTALGVAGSPHDLTAVYSGDNNFAGSQSTPEPFTVTQATTTTLVVSTPSVTYGAETATTFLVTVTSTTTGTPTGAVTVLAGTTVLCTVTLTAGAGTCKPNPTALGVAGSPHDLTAVYSGDGNFVGSSDTATLTVTQATTTTTLVVSTPSVTYGAETATTFSVTVTSTTTGTPTGTVTVLSGSTVLCTVTLTAGTGTCTPNPTALGVAGSPHDLTAVYNGDGNFVGSSGTATLTVTQATTTTTLVVSTPSVTYGAETATTFLVTVTSTTTGTPTGAVTVLAGTTVLCTVTLTAGAGTCKPNPTALGVAGSPHDLTAVYSGGANFVGSSDTGTLSVGTDTTTTVLTATPSAATYGAETQTTLAVTVTTGHGEPLPGPEQVTVDVTGTAGTTSCTATLAPAVTGGTGTCTIGATAVAVGTFTASVAYPGDTDLTGSTATAGFTVAKDSTTTTLTATPSTATYGAETATTFAVAVITGHGEPLPGTEPVTVEITGTNGAASCTATLAPAATGGTGACTIGTIALPVGSYTASVAYPGDTDLDGSSSTTTFVVTFTVVKDSTTTVLSATPSTATYGAETATTFAVTVTTGHGEPLPGAEPVTVDVTGTAGSTTCTVTLTPAGSGGTGACTIGARSVGAGSSTASVAYPGDTDLTGSGATTAFTVTQATTTTTLVVSTPSVTYGAETATTFSVTVTSTTTGTPTGAVTVLAGTTVLCTVTLTAGAGTCTPNPTALGVAGSPHDLTAVYSGGANFVGSSDTGTLSVGTDTTTTVLTATPSAATYGAETQTTLAVTVTTGHGEPLPGAEPVTVDVTGTAGTTSCTATLAPAVTGGTGTCTIGATAVAVGTFTASVAYPGDTDLTGSTATAVFTVAKAGSSTRITVTPGSVQYGHEQTVTVTATVASTTSGTPSGTVTVTAGSTTLCTVTLSGGTGTCTLQPTALDATSSTYTITASYSGDGNFHGSAATPPASLTVTPSGSVTTLTAVPSTVVYGAEASVTFGVQVSGTGAGTPAGQVTVRAGTAVLCTLTLSGGTGSCTTTATALPAAGGAYQVVAGYAGDADFSASTSAGVPLTVTPAATSTAVTSSTSLAVPGHQVTFTATVRATPATAGTPTGTVRFTAGAAVLCTATPLSGGVATCTQVAPVATQETVTAAYAGSGNDSPSSGSTAQQIQHGYWTVAADGGVFSFGDATFYGSMGGKPLNAPMVGIAPTIGGTGYWTVAADGGIFSYGSAQFYGSTGSMKLNAPIVAMVPTADDHGYWLVASDGGIFAFGDAGFFGSMGGQHLNAPIVGMVPTADDQGYWLVGADGGVFAFGDAGFFGSGSGTVGAGSPVVGLAATPSGKGYWLAASDGSVYSFGQAQFYGSMGGTPLNHPVVGIGSTADGGGYWLVASDGGIFSFGDAIYDGSMGGQPLNSPMVGIAAL